MLSGPRWWAPKGRGPWYTAPLAPPVWPPLVLQRSGRAVPGQMSTLQKSLRPDCCTGCRFSLVSEWAQKSQKP